MWELQEYYQQLQMKIVGMVTTKNVQLAVSWMESEPALIHTQIIKRQSFSDIKTY